MCSSLGHTNRCSASVRCLIYERWNAWKAQALVEWVADLAYIRSEAIFVPVLCGKNAGGLSTGFLYRSKFNKVCR